MMSAHFHNDSNDRRAGFSLLELIGVMTVISILLAAAIPLTVNVIQSQRLADEKAALPALAEALKRGILREQAFPIYQNGISRSQETADDYYWWNLAARHGAGSANEARYPLGSRNNEGNVRKLYFAEPDWGEDTLDNATGNGVPFHAITEDGFAKSSTSSNDGWVFPLDPRELRLLLLSTTNPDLPLPDMISGTEFNNLWNDWAVGSDGAPINGSWSNYNLQESFWQPDPEEPGYGSQLVVQRVDLREWLCEVNIENRRRINLQAGTDEAIFEGNDLGGLNNVECVIDTISAVLRNQNGTQVALDIEKNQSSQTEKLIRLRVVQVGTIAETSTGEDPKILIEGLPNGGTELEQEEIPLALTTLAPIDLLDRNNDLYKELLEDWGNEPEAILRTRYYFPGQKLLLNTWVPPVEPADEPIEVGEYIIQRGEQTLRFDGQRWRY